LGLQAGSAAVHVACAPFDADNIFYNQAILQYILLLLSINDENTLEAVLDSIDARLLNLLQEDCSRSLAELGKRVGLSISAVNERLKRLRGRGDIRAYVALINPVTIGYSTCAFVRVFVEGKKNEQAFVESALNMPEVQECHHVSGELPYLLKVWTRSLAHLEELLDQEIKTKTGVVRVEVMIVLSSPKDRVTGLVAT
jgi:Lrp/AsnC family transcriptional regulator, leucine-responsive regulatory protein